VLFEAYGRSVFKDQRALSFDFVPPKLVHREAQLRKLALLFRPVVESNFSQSVVLTGPVGTGKSATSKRFCLDLREHAEKKAKAIDFVVVNCRQRNSEAAALLQIVSHFQPRFPDRGFSIAEMLEILRKDLEKRHVHLIVVLDEADVLIRRAGSDLTYKLLRFGEEKAEGRALISVILVSQKNVLEMLDPAVVSSFKRTNLVEFPRYNAQELRDIIVQRAALALKDGMLDAEAIDLMADIAAEFGDARFAIELLEKAGMLADEEAQLRMTVEHVRAAKAEAYSVVTESKLAGLTKHQQLALIGIARAVKGRAYATTGEVEKAYAVACEEHEEKPRAHTAFWSCLRELDALGLIDAKKSGAKISGRTQFITIRDLPAAVMEEKILALLAEGAPSA